MAVEQIYGHLATLPQSYPAENAIHEAAARANAKIAAVAKAPDSPFPRMGSTVVVALVQQKNDGTSAWIGHVGDSRAYLLRAGRLHRLTVDHTAVQSLLNRDMITPEEALHHPDAMVLTRSLGQQREVEIEIERHLLGIGDTLLLCSDGLWRFVSEKEIQLATADLTVEAAARSLLELAISAGGQGNIGIEMARVILPPAVAPRRHEFSLAFKWILVIFLLAISGLCALAYFAFWRL
jgi:protein phosphatase